MKILNAKGEEVKLSKQEALVATAMEKKIMNDTGYKADITTLTTILKDQREQKFFEVSPATFIPIRAGEGSWSLSLTSFNLTESADDFESGIVKTGANDSKLASVDAGVEPVTVPVLPWAKTSSWTIMDINYAMKSGNWDIVISKEKARKKNWDLGIQKIAFQGSAQFSLSGLYTQSAATVNTADLTEKISGMTAAELNTFVSKVLGLYRANCNYTAWPTHFVLPESDYNGLMTFTDPAFPVKTKLAFLEEAFRSLTKNPNFQVYGLPYGGDLADQTQYKYCLYKYDVESLRMDIPVDYTSTLANSFNGFQFQNVAYGQFTGATAYRPAEFMYFQFAK